VDALASADIAVIDQVFPSAREKEGALPISAKDLEVLAHARGHRNVQAFESRDALLKHAQTIMKKGDVVVTMGAGDIYKVISRIKSQKSNNLIKCDFSIGDKFTWKVEATAKYYVEVKTEKDLRALVKTEAFKNTQKRYILGSGANTLFADSFFDGMVIEVSNTGIEKIQEDDEYAYWRIAAGEDWIDLVERMVLRENLGGLENLAYIPGKVGSAPIQNIAAYGEAFEDVCESVEYILLPSLEHKICKGKECEFAYRQSKFKTMLKESHHGFIIWSVLLKLAKPSKHTIEAGYFSNYESLQSELAHLDGR
jgi:UDP-N-acetylenolpyruvoylglucosamine reductase